MQSLLPLFSRRRRSRWALIAALLLMLSACASQTTTGASHPTPTWAGPTLGPWIPTPTTTTVPITTAAPGTMPRVDGLLYAATMDGTVMAINPADGSTKWSVSAGSGVGMLATDHAIYVTSGDKLLALRLSDGAQLWSASGGDLIADAGGVLYLMDRQERIAALNDLTGATRWTWTPPADEYLGTLTPGAGTVVFASNVRGNGAPVVYALYGLDTRTGGVRWSRPRGNIAYGFPIVDGARVLYCSLGVSAAGGGKVGAYALSSGDPVWVRDFASFNGRDGADIKATDGQLAYLGVGEFGLAALRVGDGATIWSFDHYTSGESDPYPFKFEAGSVYAAAGGSVTKFDTSTGAPRWTQAVGANVPVLKDGAIYLSRESPDVAYALDAATGAIRWRFPVALTSFVIRNSVLFAHLDHNPIQPQLTPDTIYAIDAATGALYWKRDVPSSLNPGLALEP
jgi:outer membrane protein assembly factor BamB